MYKLAHQHVDSGHRVKASNRSTNIHNISRSIIPNTGTKRSIRLIIKTIMNVMSAKRFSATTINHMKKTSALCLIKKSKPAFKPFIALSLSTTIEYSTKEKAIFKTNIDKKTAESNRSNKNQVIG